jgi:hypothetical protein
MTKQIDVHHGRRLQDYNVRAGEAVAVRVHLTAEGCIHWTVVHDAVARWARRRRCQLQSVVLVLAPVATGPRPVRRGEGVDLRRGVDGVLTRCVSQCRPVLAGDPRSPV